LTLDKGTLNSLREIVGAENVLSDVEDLYVYSFKQIYLKHSIPLILAVIRTDVPREREEVARLLHDQSYRLVRRSAITESYDSLKPTVILDDSKQICLKSFTYAMETEKTLKHIDEFQETETGNLKKIALAQKLLFLGKTIAKCEECSVCSSYCTVASSFNSVETWSAKGRMLLIRGMMRGELSISQKLVNIIYTCSNCSLCFAQCQQRSEMPEAIRAARHRITLEGHAPNDLKAAAENILEIGDPSGLSPEKRLFWMEETQYSHVEKANVLYWVGCTSGTRTPNTPRAIMRILHSAEVEVALLREEEGCCGYILLTSGLWDEAKKNAIKIIEKIDQTGAKIIVTSCAGCYYTFAKLFPEILGVELPCEVLHTSELLENLIGEGQINIAAINTRVTFHDPCSLGRHSKVYDAPRKVLTSIPELQYVEIALNRDRARCCGGGGGLWSFNNKVSMNSATNRLRKDITPLNIDVVTTACPICQMNLRFASMKNSIPVKICDFAEIVDMAVANAINTK